MRAVVDILSVRTHVGCRAGHVPSGEKQDWISGKKPT